MTTENYFETELGFLLTAHEANNILIALSDLYIYYNQNGYQNNAKDIEKTRRHLEKQLKKYENL